MLVWVPDDQHATAPVGIALPLGVSLDHGQVKVLRLGKQLWHSPLKALAFPGTGASGEGTFCI